MIIKKVGLQNYRGISEREEIPLGSFCSIVGRNDSGKSIILNAIASFLNTKDFPIEPPDFFDSNEAIVMDFHFTSPELRNQLESKIKSKVKKTDGLDEFISDILFDNAVVLRKTFKDPGKSASTESLLVRDFEDADLSGLYAKDDTLLDGIMAKYSVSIPAKGKGRNSKLEKIKFIKEHLSKIGASIKEQWIPDEYKITALLPSVELFYSDYGLKADTSFKTSSVTEILDYFKREAADSSKKLAIAESEIQQAMETEADAIKDYMLEYTPNLEKVQIQPSIVWKDAIKSVDVNLRFSGDDKLIPMSHKGTGYRRLFMVARFRYLAEKGGDANIIYLIEEPETYLHPAAQEDLLNSLRNLSDENQVILTTHSPVFAGAMKFDSVILCRKNGRSTYTHTGKVDEMEFVSEIIAELGVRPSYNLRDKYEKILFVESKNDWIFYDCICKALFGLSLIQNERILVLPFGGGDNIESFVNIEHFGETGRDLYMIIDSDKCQGKEKQQEASVVSFIKKKKAKGLILQKSCIENYYHPRALERVYRLNENTFDFFADADNARERIKEVVKREGLKQIREKNNLEVFRATTKEEWEAIVEKELVEFLQEIVS